MDGYAYLLTTGNTDLPYRPYDGSRGKVQLLLRDGVSGQRGNMDGTAGGSDGGGSGDDSSMMSDRSERGMGSGQDGGVRGSVGMDGSRVGSSGMSVRVGSMGVRISGMSVRPGRSVSLDDGGTVSGVRISGIRVTSLGGDGQGDDGNDGNDALPIEPGHEPSQVFGMLHIFCTTTPGQLLGHACPLAPPHGRFVAGTTFEQKNFGEGGLG
uniref:Uncharacterized protein n=1 Tax=Anopheles farauti TaxID=69004 RepID=A0A182Q4D0_9DIPT